MRGTRLHQAKLQTAGEFKRGDLHPEFPSLCYYAWSKKENKQKWITIDGLEKYRKQNSKQNAAYLKTNPHLSAKRTAKRRSKIREARKILTASQEKLIEQYYKYAARLTKKLNIAFQVDHTTPLSRGGKHEPNNLQVVPATWNLRKNNRNTEKWQPSPI